MPVRIFPSADVSFYIEKKKKIEDHSDLHSTLKEIESQFGSGRLLLRSPDIVRLASQVRVFRISGQT